MIITVLINAFSLVFYSSQITEFTMKTGLKENSKRPRGRPKIQGPSPAKRPVGRPPIYGSVIQDNVKRARALNNLASRKCRKARKERQACQERELSNQLSMNKRLNVKVAVLKGAIIGLKQLLRKEGIFQIWRPWLDETRSFIKIHKPD